MSAPGILIAAPASGSGKTTITLALLRALRRQGLKVGAFKVGPDYLDPMLHARAAGRPAANLDSWAMRIDTLAGLADQVASGVDIVIGEGVMGLFDGAADGQGSTADLASLLDLPVILVVDARGMAASAAALVEGFTRHRDDVEIAGVIFNRVASEEHAALLRRACDDRFAQPVLACLPLEDRAGAALTPPRAGAGGRGARARGLPRARRGPRRRAHRSRPAAASGPALRARPLRPAAAPAAPSRPAHRGRRRPGVRLRLPRGGRGLADRRRRDPAVLAARRRGARCERRCGLPAGRLSRAARRRGSPRARAFSPDCARRRRAAPSSMASAAASWRSAAG